MRSSDWNCLAQAFDHISETDPAFTELLLKLPAQYDWVLVNDQLAPSKVTASYLYLHGKKMATVANRHLDTISINRSAWKNMHSFDRAALIFHEIFYAATEASADQPSKQEPITARNLTAEVFQFQKKELHLRRELAGDHLDEPLKQGEVFEPTRFEYPIGLGNQSAIVFRRIKHLSDGHKELSPTETTLRTLYSTILVRPGADFEIYWWLTAASKLHYTCPQILDAFALSGEFSKIDADTKKVIVDRALKLAQMKIPEGNESLPSILSRNREAICGGIKPIVQD
jgi:hypothetical protein